MNVDDQDERRDEEQEPTAEQPPGPQAPADQAPTQPLGSGSAPQARRLLRSQENRVLGGVCGGLGRYFNVDPVFFRIGAIVLALVGGAGILLYLAALLLIPSGDAVGAPAAPGTAGETRNRGLVIAGVVLLVLVTWPFLLGGGLLFAGLVFPLALLVAAGVLVWWLVSGEGPSGDAGEIAKRAALGVGVLILCGLVAVGGAWAAAAGGEALVAGLVIAAGVAVAAGAFYKPVRWLVLPAVALALSAGAVSAAGIDLDGGVGEREYRPASTVDLKDRYELGMGELVLDLRDTDLPAGDTPLEIDMGVGEARLIVAPEVCVVTRAEVGVGEVRFFNRTNEGVDVDFLDAHDATPSTSRLVVDADIGVGSLRVGETDGGIPLNEASFAPQEGLAFGTNDACLGTGESANR